MLTSAEGVQAVSEVPPCDAKVWSLARAVATLSATEMLGPLGAESASASWPAFIAPLASDQAAAHIPAQALGAALGGALGYLKRCHCAVDIVTQRKFAPIRFGEEGDIAGGAAAAAAGGAAARLDPRAWEAQPRLVLDSAALRNLDVLQTEAGKLQGSLLGLLDCCKTPFGKRLLRRWVVAPSCNISTIEQRLDCVAELMESVDLLDEARNILSAVVIAQGRPISKQMERNRKDGGGASQGSQGSQGSRSPGSSRKSKRSKMPDLERICARVHIQGSKFHAKSVTGHPDGRAIMYENAMYVVASRLCCSLCSPLLRAVRTSHSALRLSSLRLYRRRRRRHRHHTHAHARAHSALAYPSTGTTSETSRHSSPRSTGCSSCARSAARSARTRPRA